MKNENDQKEAEKPEVEQKPTEPHHHHHHHDDDDDDSCTAPRPCCG